MSLDQHFLQELSVNKPIALSIPLINILEILIVNNVYRLHALS